ncbi:Asp23/Gls24 family envelope stress response protein [Hugonella massiliensis]|uniref:Asp23/Gls24 family envelope stress response protein n=1 Tax=Hugonella massiliensis TaxID=1720315 RepID=UPI00073E6A92|nr:Asp23/Gls24 family envelope stress response protein [Hugonella massiliensis]MDD6729710.1 Asp23/Gls24 family envelope stress response protein [Eggerthellaceae bacterium]
MSDLNIGGMALADGVIETIIAIAVKDVEGVASVGTPASASLLSQMKAKPSTQGIDVEVNDDDTVTVSVRIEVFFGQVLPEVAARVRESVSDAVLTQVGVKVAAVNVFIDGLRFE